jgi:transcriptional regulator with XRE-family HTH domain
MDEYIKATIKARIKELGTTQADVARKIGVTPQAVSNVLKEGNVSIPSSLLNVLNAVGLKLVVEAQE